MGSWVHDVCLITLAVVVTYATVVTLCATDEHRANRAGRLTLIAIRTIGTIICATGGPLADVYPHDVLGQLVHVLVRAALAIAPWLGSP